MELAKARRIAEDLIAKFEPHCEPGRCRIAGSVRRGKSDVHDIEIVAQPQLEPVVDMLGEVRGYRSLLDPALRDLGEFRLNGPRQKQIRLPEDIYLDLFICLPPSTWGVLYTLRTGPGDFSKWLVTPRAHSGAMPGHLHEKDNALWCGAEQVETPEETDFFKALGLEWIEPAKRVPAWRKAP